MRKVGQRVLAMSVLGCGLTACSTSYFTDLVNTSRVYADLASPGLISWTYAKPSTSGGSITGSSVITPPSVTVTLDPNSSPVTLNTAQADFYDTTASADSKGKPALTSLGLNTMFFPFNAVLQQKDRATQPQTTTVVLNGLVNISLVNLTYFNPNPGASDSNKITSVVGKVTLQGSNALGQKVSANVNVPINVTYGAVPQ